MNRKTSIKNSPDQLETILNSIGDGVFTVDEEWTITFFNRAAEKITGVPRQEAVGSRCCDVFRASICETDCALRHTIDTGKPVINRAVYIINSDGKRIPISISTSLLRDGNGKIIGGVQTFRDLSRVERLRKELEKSYTFEDIVSKSAAMLKIFNILPAIANSDSTVLIEGASGTGKELIARAIHNLSPRKKRPLIAVNCGALPDTLLESELFGYKAGAFTDAKKDKPGRFVLANGGTIFLDEIGDISPALQVRLLRVLQEKAVEPLGGVGSVKIDVRVLAATNRDLSKLVDEGKFRQDLFYRINIIRLVMPPLVERKEDIPILVEHFIGKLNQIYGKDINGVSPETLRILMKHDFPGNIRELENILEHAFVLCEGGIILPDHLPDNLSSKSSAIQADSASTLNDLEAQFLLAALKRNAWNRQATAEELGIHKTTLYRKIHKLNLNLPDRDGRSKGLSEE